MTTVSGTISANGVGQYIAIDPTTASHLLTLANNSTDQLVFSWADALASQTHGVVVVAGGVLPFTPGSTRGLTYPWGPISVWGPTKGHAWAVSAT
jgi:hypothetical protein